MKTFLEILITLFIIGPILFGLWAFAIYLWGAINVCKLLIYILFIVWLIKFIIENTGSEEESEDE